MQGAMIIFLKSKFRKDKSARLINIIFEKKNDLKFSIKDKLFEKNMVLLSGDQTN